MNDRIDRRQFLRQSLMAVATLSVAGPEFSVSAQEEIRRAGAAKKVVVIGAGLAGMSAAWELTKTGHEVTVLEARSRCGGRVYTVRGPFADGLYAEAGATHVNDVHDWTLKYVKELDVALDPVVPRPGLGYIYYMRGQRFVVKRGSPVELPLALSAEEKAVGRARLYEKYVTPAIKEIGDAAAPDWPSDSLKRYDQVTYSEFLRRQGASPDAVMYLRLGLADTLGDGPNAVSALNLLREYASRAGVKQSNTIRGGSDTLPKAFASRLGERILYGLPVVKIEHDAGGVRIICSQAGTHRAFAADYLICAVPFAVLKHVEISPALSSAKREAIAQLGNTSVVRVFLQTRKRFWLDEGLSGGASTDLPLMSVYDKVYYLPGPRGILEAYVAGPNARHLAAMKENDRLSFTIEQMQKVHPAIREHVEGASSICWGEDEWARGAYAWFKPGQMTALLPHIAKPEGRVYFAGDHTSPWPGWMQGALQSGNRAAREVNQVAGPLGLRI